MTVRRAAWMAAFAVVVLVRLVGLDGFPLSHPDEGGWPLAVREWVETGQRSGDFYMAPGYHWLLGIPFYLFGSLHSVSRPVSAVVSLLTLLLFYRLTLRMAGRSTALAATLLLGTCYPAVLIDRRALIEPFQMALIMTLCLIVSPFLTGERPRVWRYFAAVGLTALLLLTKASGAFILPAIAVALALSLGSWKPRLGLLAALAAGTAAAAAVFWSLYLGDPAMFLSQWQADMSTVNVPGTRPDGAGRFAFHPFSIERTIRWYSEYEPLLSGLAILGLLKAVWERQHTLMAAWLGCGALFLFAQLYVQENHRVILLPALCFFAAHLLVELHRSMSMQPQPRISWAQAALALMVMYSVARLGVGLARTKPVEAAAARWLEAHTTAQSRVMAAPFVLMRLRSQPISFWRLDKPFVPTPEQLRRLRPEWLVVEIDEWQSEQEKFGSPEALRQALRDCCEVAFTSPGATVYRVRKEALALTAP